MGGINSGQKTIRVKEYLVRRIRQANGEPLRLPNEMDIAETCGVSRITVRSAIRELENQKYIIRIPGRRGAFANPMSDSGSRYTIGILQTDTLNRNFSHLSLRFLKHFLDEMEALDCSCDFLSPALPKDRSAADMLRDLAYDGILWLCPDDEYIPAINELTEQGFPIVVMDDFNSWDRKKTDRNMVVRSEAMDLAFLRFMAERGCRKSVYLGDNPFFLGRSGKNGPFLNTKPLSSFEEITKGLPRLLSAHPETDSILCDGPVFRYCAVEKVLDSCKEWQKIPLFLNQYGESLRFRSAHPELKVILYPGYASVWEKAGRIAGRMMLRFLNHTITGFENIGIGTEKEKKGTQKKTEQTRT